MLNILPNTAQGIRVPFGGSAQVIDSRTVRATDAAGIRALKKAVRSRRSRDRGFQP